MQKILLIHDDQDAHETLKLMLEMAGFDVTALQRADECLDSITKDVCLVISDILIHGMTGFELCTKIREEFSSDRLPVVLCSTLYRGRAFIEEAENVGAQDYFIRPSNLDELVRRARELSGPDEETVGDGVEKRHVA